MAKFTLSEIQDAFEFVNSGGISSNSALLCKDTGKILYKSDDADLDEIGNIEKYDFEMCFDIPDKNDLRLGRTLVYEFVDKNLPNDYEIVEQFFKHRGAYSRYKNLLENRGLLQEWYDFENKRQKDALLEWCNDRGIEIEE